MKFKPILIPLALGILLLQLPLLQSSGEHGDPLPKDQFDECVKQCGIQLEHCLIAVKKLWLQFSTNKAKIVKYINRCCLRGQDDHDEPSDVSFATCVRNECNAQLWGCVIKKRHAGAYSKEEIEYIKRMEDKKKHQASKKAPN